MAYITGIPYAQGMGSDGGQAVDWDALLKAHREGRTNGDTFKFVEQALRDTTYDQGLHDQMLAAHQHRMGFNVHDPWIPLQQPDMNGMGNDGGQRTPTNTGAVPTNGLEGSGGPEWTGPTPDFSAVTPPDFSTTPPPASAAPVDIWGAVPGSGPAQGQIQTPNWGGNPAQGGSGVFPAAPQATQNMGVGPANGMDNFNNAAHSTWRSQYEDMMAQQQQNVQNQQARYPVGPRNVRGLIDEEQYPGLLS
jgi:hypothetical protein